MSAAPALLEVRGVDFRYDDGKPVLAGCSLSVPRGDRYAILGTSGSGKSTLLRLVLGLLAPDSGSILFEGRDVTRLSEEERNAVRRRIGMVFQNAALISSLSVRDNLALPLRELTDQSPAEIDRIVADKLALVGMEGAADLLPAELSGGMRKRVGLARALTLAPEMVLFDEPSAGLDPVATALIDRLIVSLSAKVGTTCIVVTHNLGSAFRIATRMAMLHDGAVLLEDTPDRFRESQEPIVRQFVTGAAEGPLTRDHEGVSA